MAISDVELIDKEVYNYGGSTSTKLEVPLDSSAVLTLDKLTMKKVWSTNLAVVTKFIHIMAHVTYPVLSLGKIDICMYEKKEEERKIARRRIVSALLLHKPSPGVQQLILNQGCRIENMDIIEACITVTQIQLDNASPPTDFSPTAVQDKLQEIATRNRNLARFVANPQDHYPGENELLKLLCQFDSSPTGRYLLASCFPNIPSFFKIQGATT